MTTDSITPKIKEKVKDEKSAPLAILNPKKGRLTAAPTSGGVQDSNQRECAAFGNRRQTHQKHTWPGRGPAVAAGEAGPTVVAGVV